MNFVKKRTGFSLVELLVVIGIIAVLIGILLPTLTKARKQANSVACKANLHTLGQFLLMYVNDNHGWLYPVGPEDPRFPGSGPTTLGTNVPPDNRWPMHMVSEYHELKLAPVPTYNAATYIANQSTYDPITYPAEPYTPRTLRCPEDEQPYEAHSYVLNKHLADRAIKYGSKNFGLETVSDVVVAGEKKTTVRDYYMEHDDFDRVVEPYRHGLQQGSNYLKLDWHVDTNLPDEAKTGIDPWDLKTPDPTTQPGT